MLVGSVFNLPDNYMKISVLLGLSFLVCILFFSPYPNYDFIEYWSAFRLANQGLNYYDGVVMGAFQLENFGKEVPTMMWNPPWLLSLMSPVLVLPFEQASSVWTWVNCCLYFLSAFLLTKSDAVDRRGLTFLLLALLYPPFWNCLEFGQVGAILLLGTSLFLHGVRHKQNICSAFGLLFMSIKPHLFLLLFLFVFWQAIKRVSLVPILLAGLFCLLASLPILISGSPALLEWLPAFISKDTSGAAIHPFSWVGATPLSATRAYLGGEFARVVFVVPLACVALASIHWVRKRQWEITENYYLGVLTLGFLCSPFGWFFDLVAFLPLLTKISGVRVWVTLALFGVTFLFTSQYNDFQHQSFWFFPTLCLIVWWPELRDGLDRYLARV